MCALGNTHCGSKQHQTAGTGLRKYVPGGLKHCGILQSALMTLIASRGHFEFLRLPMSKPPHPGGL